MPPQHLRGMIEAFEIAEVPSIGLLPRPLGATATASTPTSEQQEETMRSGAGAGTPVSDENGPSLHLEGGDEDMEFFVS